MFKKSKQDSANRRVVFNKFIAAFMLLIVVVERAQGQELKPRGLLDQLEALCVLNGSPDSFVFCRYANPNEPSEVKRTIRSVGMGDPQYDETILIPKMVPRSSANLGGDRVSQFLGEDLSNYRGSGSRSNPLLGEEQTRWQPMRGRRSN